MDLYILIRSLLRCLLRVRKAVVIPPIEIRGAFAYPRGDRKVHLIGLYVVIVVLAIHGPLQTLPWELT